MLSEIRDSTHFSFSPSLFPLHSQGEYKSWHIPTSEMLVPCQLGQEQHVCYPQTTRLPPVFQKAPHALAAEQTAGEPTAAEAPVKPGGRSALTSLPRLVGDPSKLGTETEAGSDCKRGRGWPAQRWHWNLHYHLDWTFILVALLPPTQRGA